MDLTTFFRRKRVGSLCALFTCAMCVPGCSDGRPQCVPVHGVIKFNGKPEWPAKGYLHFFPISSANGFPKRAGLADFDQEGNFTARTFRPGDGLFPGKYRVQINCWKERPTQEKTRGVSYVPHRYRKASTSGIEVTIAPDEDECQFTIEVASQ